MPIVVFIVIISVAVALAVAVTVTNMITAMLVLIEKAHITNNDFRIQNDNNITNQDI